MEDVPCSSTLQRKELYGKMEKCVVRIVVTRMGGPKVFDGGVVVVHQKGYVLTSALVVPNGNKSIHCSLKGVKDVLEYHVVRKDEKEGLAILGPEKSDLDMECAKFGEETSLRTGLDVFSIFHPSQMEFTFVVGQLAYDCKTDTTQCCRTVGDLVKDGRVKIPKDTLLSQGRKNLFLIQLANFHGDLESFGSPVFTSSGQIIGIYSLVHNFIDYAIHVKELQNFCKNFFQVEKGDSSKSALGGRKRGRH